MAVTSKDEEYYRRRRREQLALRRFCVVAGLGFEGLLKSLGPAPDTDPRFTTWTAPGPIDGKHGVFHGHPPYI
jgi:hypothetical protein